MDTVTDSRTIHERNRADCDAAIAASGEDYIGDKLCPSGSGTDRCGYLRGHKGIHVGLFGSWCDKGHPCRSARQHIDFDKHPNHYVCPRCSATWPTVT